MKRHPSSSFGKSLVARRQMVQILLLVAPAFACRGSSDGRMAACPTCKINIHEIAILHPDTIGSEFVGATRVVRDFSGKFFAGPLALAGLISRFDSTGHNLPPLHLVEPGSMKPLEVQRMRVGPGDSLWVLDSRSGMNTFDAAGNFIRRIKLEYQVVDFALARDGIVLEPFTRVGQRGVFMLTNRDGDSVSWLGGKPPKDPIFNKRLLTSDQVAGKYWTASEFEPNLVALTTSNNSNSKDSIHTRLDWIEQPSPGHTHVGRIEGLETDDKGLWILISRRIKDPTLDKNAAPGRGGIVQLSTAQMENMYNWTVKFVGLSNNYLEQTTELSSSKRFAGLASGGILFGPGDDPNGSGIDVMHVWKLSLVDDHTNR